MEFGNEEELDGINEINGIWGGEDLGRARGGERLPEADPSTSSG